MNFKELLKQKLNEQALIIKGAINASRAMTEEEQKTYDALEIEIKNLEKTIEAEEKLKERELQAKTPVNEPIYAQPRDPNEKKWKGGMGEFLQAVATASKPGGRMVNVFLSKALHLVLMKQLLLKVGFYWRMISSQA